LIPLIDNLQTRDKQQTPSTPSAFEQARLRIAIQIRQFSENWLEAIPDDCARFDYHISRTRTHVANAIPKNSLYSSEHLILTEIAQALVK